MKSEIFVALPIGKSVPIQICITYRILVAIQTSENWEQTLLDFVPGGSVDHIRGGGGAGGRGTWW